MSVTTGSIVTVELIAPQLARGGLGLGQVVGDVVLVEQHLPLEVVRLDEVAVDDADEADAGADQVVGQHGAERTAAAQRDAAVEQLLLARFADAGETHLPAVSFEGGVFAHGSFELSFGSGNSMVWSSLIFAGRRTGVGVSPARWTDMRAIRWLLALRCPSEG